MKQQQEDLGSFIIRARAAGKTTADIRDRLVRAGWQPDAVDRALADELVPPPPPAPRSSGREIFFHLLQFLTLGISAVSLGGVVFSIINAAWPDAVAQAYPTPSTPALAALIVALPVFLVVSWHLLRELARGAVSTRSAIRRVLTYLALFIASATIIGDVTELVRRFLAGEVKVSFLAKVVTILLIGGWVLWYYWYTVRREERSERPAPGWHRANAVVLVGVSLVAIAASFALTGGPQRQQQVVRDAQRVNDLSTFSSFVQQYYDQEGKLPSSLAEISARFGFNPSDPLRGTAYGYVLGTGGAYELCATFEAESSSARYPVAEPYAAAGYSWNHPAGDYCFSLHAVLNPKQPTK